MFILQSQTILENSIGQSFTFENINSVEIATSRKELTDTATLVLPSETIVDGARKQVADVTSISRGDKVTIYLGYKPDLVKEFVGYVNGVEYGPQLRINLEDAMFFLKQTSFSDSIGTDGTPATMTQLLDMLTNNTGIEYEVDFPDAIIGKFTVDRATAAQALKKIKKTYGQNVFMYNGKLIVGLSTPAGVTANVHNFDFERNIIDDDLRYQKEDDIPTEVHATSMQADNTKVEVFVGSKGGTTSKMSIPGLDRATLTRYANNLLEKITYTGYRGSLTSFGAPSARHVDNALLYSSVNPGRGGVYDIEAVVKTYTADGGYRQDITLGALLRELTDSERNERPVTAV